jgi:hypothetical protein
MTTRAEIPVVPPRQPCPCGSGRRYKACHGSDRASRQIVARPFAGRADEPDLVALREVVPAATAPLTLTDGRTALLATVLPMAWPAMKRSDGQVLVGLQVPGRSGDVSRDVAQALLRALDAEPGTPITTLDRAADDGPALQDVLDPAPIEVTVRDGFEFWVEGVTDVSGEVSDSLERANAAIGPTARLSSVTAAYWCRMKERAHLRWALPDDEDPLLDAMARLAAGHALGLGEGTRYVGSFRAHGLLVPVWDLPHSTEAAAVEEPAAALRARLDEELAGPRPLSDEEKRSRAGLLSRQLTLR